jgi:hypothetical protein
MTRQELEKLWEFAGGVDPTLRGWKAATPLLQRKYLRAQRYTRTALFSRMMQAQPSVFMDFPVRLRQPFSEKRSALLEVIKNGFSTRTAACVQVDCSHCTTMRVGDLLRRWDRGRSIVSVTDLHFRKTNFEKSIDTSALSDFNVLCADPQLIDKLEMMTLVISSKGNLTDTHTDDCDGSNHCFLGKKLWLCWDRMEGRAKGFEDVDRDRDKIEKFARFDLASFLSLRTSRWFVVRENETLFLPGSLSHKVITCEDYIGVGSFHVALPSYVRALRRWILYDSLDVQPKNLLERINRAVIARVRKLKKSPARICERWGLPYLNPSIERLFTLEGRLDSKQLLANPIFSAFLEAAAKR